MATTRRFPALSRVRWHWLWLALPLLASAWTRGLWAPDEPRYAEVAREIHESGDWLVLHLCGQVYPDKPPLLYWLAAALGWVSGWSEGAMRLVSVASACGTAWLCGVLARRWWGKEEGRAAPAFFLGTVMMTVIGGRLQIDPLLAFLCTWALVEVDASARARERAVAHLLRAGLACGLAALAKGPVAFANVGLVAIAWWLGPKTTALVRPGWRAVAGAVALAILPVLLWALLAAAREPELGRQLFYGQHVGRAVEGKQHAGPFWKHLVNMPLLLMPWTVLVVLGLVQAWRSSRTRARNEERDEGLWRAALWLLVLLSFFSILPPKRDLYLLPAYPAAALIAARWLVSAAQADRLPSGAARRGWPAWVGSFGTCFFAVVGALLIVAGPVAMWLGEERLGGLDAGSLAWRCLPPAAVALLGARASARAVRARDPVGWARAAWVTWASGVAMLAVLLCPLVDPLKSARILAEWLAARTERPLSIPCLGVQPEGYRFYGRVPTIRDDDVAAALDRDGAQFLALVREQEYEGLPSEVRARTAVLHRARVGSRDVLVLGAVRAGEDDAKTGSAER